MPNAIRPDISALSEQQSRLFITNNFIGRDALDIGSPSAKLEAAATLSRQMEAIKQINDQGFLKEIALSRRNTGLCAAAASRINDQAYLKEISFASAVGKVRAAAVRGITDQKLLMRLVLRDGDHNVVDAACSGFKDQEVMARYLISRPSTPKNDFRKRIMLRHITDQSLLKELSYHHDLVISGSRVATDVLLAVKDEHFVKDVVSIYLHLGEGYLRPAILERISDQDFLKKVAADESISFNYRAASALRINDSAFLVSAVSDVLKKSRIFGEGVPIKLKHNLSKEEVAQCKFVSGALGRIDDYGFIESLSKDSRAGLLIGDAISSRLSELKSARKDISDLQRDSD